MVQEMEVAALNLLLAAIHKHQHLVSLAWVNPTSNHLKIISIYNNSHKACLLQDSSEGTAIPTIECQSSKKNRYLTNRDIIAKLRMPLAAMAILIVASNNTLIISATFRIIHLISQAVLAAITSRICWTAHLAMRTCTIHIIIIT